MKRQRRTRRPQYRHLVIVASSPKTDIWLADDHGHLVQKETGTLDTIVEKGFYTVEFGLGNITFPIRLTRNTRYTETRLKCGPSCPRPALILDGRPVRKQLRKAMRRPVPSDHSEKVRPIIEELDVAVDTA